MPARKLPKINHLDSKLSRMPTHPLTVRVDDDFHEVLQGICEERGFKTPQMLKAGLELFLEVPLKEQKILHDEQIKVFHERPGSVKPCF